MRTVQLLRSPRRRVSIRRLGALAGALAGALLVPLLACGGTREEGHGETLRPIVNGQLHSGHPAVGGLFQGHGGMCTATLVGSRTVLTAAHCVEPGAGHLFVLGSQRWDVEGVARHPAYDTELIANDVAIVRLRKVPPIEPARIAALPPERGQRVSLLGLGATSDDGSGSGLMRIAQNTVDQIVADRISYRFASGDVGNLCFGDSGGPTFALINAQEVQVGVHSYISGQCGQQGTDMRVDAFRDWITQTAGGDVLIAGYPDETPPTVEIVAPAPSDELHPAVTVAADVADNIGVERVELLIDGAATGQAMSQPAASQPGGAGARYELSLELTPGLHDIEVVASDAAGLRGSARRTLTIVALERFGEVCKKPEQCESALCAAAPALAERRCSQPCDPQGTACPEGARCEAVGNTFICGPPAALLPSSAGGCAVGGAGAAAIGWSLLALLALVLVVRRRSRR